MTPPLRPLSAPPPDTRMTKAQELRLYIDSTSLSVIHQMADFVACADRPDVLKLITWLRCPLDPERLEACHGRYLPQRAAISPAFVEQVCALLRERRIGRLVVHSNHHHAGDGVFPLLRALVRERLLAPAQIVLHLYDDGRLSLRQREQLAADPQAARAMEAGARALHAAVMDGAALPRDLAANHGWHRVFDTTYHMLRPERLLAARPDLDPAFVARVQPMRFDHAERLGPEAWQRYLGWYGLQAGEREVLRALAQDPDAFLFVGTSAWDPADNARYRDLQLQSMAALRQQGLLPASARLAFKGHPANRAHQDVLAQALGQGAPVLQVPARLPLEVMLMDGLLPAAYGGVISTAFLVLPPERLRFVLCNAASRAEALQQTDVRLLLDLGIVREPQVLPWLRPQAAAAAAVPAPAPAAEPADPDARLARLEASQQQFTAAIDTLVDNLLELRNQDLKTLAERSQAQAAQLETLQAALDQERVDRALTEVSRMHPKERVVVFVGGSYFGDNVKYAWLAALQHARALDAACWFLPADERQAEQVRGTGGHCFPARAQDWSADHLHTALSAAVAVVSDHLLGSNPHAAALLAGARQVQMWHGVSIKEIGFRNLAGLAHMGPHFARVLRTCGPFSRFLGTSAGQEPEWRRWFAFDGYAPIGYPRNDVLLRAPRGHDLVNVDLPLYTRAQEFRARGRRVVLYAPTFRDGHPKWLLQAGLPELAQAVAAAGDLLLVNLHPVEQPLVPALSRALPSVGFVQARTDVYPLLRETSVLVTDYSSIMFDYLLLDRPVLLYRPDHEAYTQRSRRLFDAKLARPPGPVAHTAGELVGLLQRAADAAADRAARHALRASLHDHCDAQAGERLVQLLAAELAAALPARG